MTYPKEEAYDEDHCINSKRHPLSVIYQGYPMCDECYDKLTDKLVKEFKELHGM